MEMLGFRQMMQDRNPPFRRSAFVGMLFFVSSGRLILKVAARDGAGITPVGSPSSSSSSVRNADTFSAALDCCSSLTDGLSSLSSGSSGFVDTWVTMAACF